MRTLSDFPKLRFAFPPPRVRIALLLLPKIHFKKKKRNILPTPIEVCQNALASDRFVFLTNRKRIAITLLPIFMLPILLEFLAVFIFDNKRQRRYFLV